MPLAKALKLGTSQDPATRARAPYEFPAIQRAGSFGNALYTTLYHMGARKRVTLLEYCGTLRQVLRNSREREQAEVLASQFGSRAAAAEPNWEAKTSACSRSRLFLRTCLRVPKYSSNVTRFLAPMW